jgi:ATP-dependent Lon protease
MVIFATSNSTERLSKPLLSRFTIFEIPAYTYGVRNNSGQDN